MISISNESAQWILLLGFIVSVSLIFLAIVANESVLVGKTTSESVLDFPKSDLYDLRHAVIRMSTLETLETLPPGTPDIDRIKMIENFYLLNKSAYVKIISDPSLDQPPNVDSSSSPPSHYRNYTIHYNNGVVNYTEYLNYTRVGAW